MFKIESNIPLPPAGHGTNGGTPSKYPFKKMSVGESFLVPSLPGVCNKILRQRLSVSAYNSSCGKFSTRIFENGVRVWRVA